MRHYWFNWTKLFRVKLSFLNQFFGKIRAWDLLLHMRQLWQLVLTPRAKTSDQVSCSHRSKKIFDLWVAVEFNFPFFLWGMCFLVCSALFFGGLQKRLQGDFSVFGKSLFFYGGSVLRCFCFRSTTALLKWTIRSLGVSVFSHSLQLFLGCWTDDSARVWFHSTRAVRLRQPNLT